MISRRSSDRSPRTDSTQRRPTIRRGIKKRGILPSFGDIVLPIVSVAAVGLLVLAGRQFFLNGIKTSPGISSTRAYAEAPALIAERERKKEKEAEVYVSVPVAEEKDENPALDSIVKQEAKQEINAASIPETQKQTPVNVSQTPPKKILPAPAKPVQAAKPQPPKPQVKPQPKAQTAKIQASSQKKNEPAKPAKKETKETPVKASSTPSSKQWRVQIGAYTSKSGAQEAANKLKKAGYSAVVYSNPASKHHKVWVAGGANKKDAERVVNAMKKLGYGSSFAFPPAK
ncbi:MAG: SPOR domain-containing protein, partial [Synergistaceae bacterium]|nr:SPOR domain-containing protein [Synergistaceae bacterium]